MTMLGMNYQMSGRDESQSLHTSLVLTKMVFNEC